ncbi:Dual specificity protein phosphatase 2, variant 2 [Balamuthia mandrillaris]
MTIRQPNEEAAERQAQFHPTASNLNDHSNSNNNELIVVVPLLPDESVASSSFYKDSPATPSKMSSTATTTAEEEAKQKGSTEATSNLSSSSTSSSSSSSSDTLFYERVMNEGRKVDMAEILRDFLYLGSMKAARQREVLKYLKAVTHVCNVTSRCQNFFPQDFTYRTFRLEDVPQADIGQCFAPAIEFLDNARKAGGRVLVHCSAGVSRSTTLVLAYLMAREGMTLRQAFIYVKRRRHVVRPNNGFLMQLVHFEKTLFGRTSIKEDEIANITQLYRSTWRSEETPVPLSHRSSTSSHCSLTLQANSPSTSVAATFTSSSASSFSAVQNRHPKPVSFLRVCLLSLLSLSLSLSLSSLFT